MRVVIPVVVVVKRLFYVHFGINEAVSAANKENKKTKEVTECVLKSWNSFEGANSPDDPC